MLANKRAVPYQTPLKLFLAERVQTEFGKRTAKAPHRRLVQADYRDLSVLHSDRAALMDFSNTFIMERSAGINHPFFAYGIFRPGQLGFFQLKELVSEITDPSQVVGSLLLRDDLPHH